MIRAPGVNAVLNGLAVARQILRRKNAFEEAVIGRRGAGGTVPVDTIYRERMGSDYSDYDLLYDPLWYILCANGDYMGLQYK
jgi:hypothetical protein